MTELKDRIARGDSIVVLRAMNGDVIRATESGLLMRLSDEVVEDLRQRLAVQQAVRGATQAVDAATVGDIDAWNARQSGDWIHFEAVMPGTTAPRGYVKHLSGGDVFADAPGPLLGLFSLGGARRSLGYDLARAFPYHVTAPGDHCGAAGWAGTEAEETVGTLQRVVEPTRSVMIAEDILAQRAGQARALPLFFVREQSDTSASVQELMQGPAFRNLLASARSLGFAAEALGKRPGILAICLDFCLEHAVGTAEGYRDGMLALMAKVTTELVALGYRKPVFVATFETGTRASGIQPHLLAQWELAWNPAGHDLVFSAPGFMFAQDEFGRPTPEAVLDMAAMDSMALAEVSAGRKWTCPLFLLAEQDGNTVRVTVEALDDLVVDPDDPLAAGPDAGFRLLNDRTCARITSVSVCAETRRDVVLTFDKAPEGDGLRLVHAYGASDSVDRLPANRSAVRDCWSRSTDRGLLHRWALPCDLPVN